MDDTSWGDLRRILSHVSVAPNPAVRDGEPSDRAVVVRAAGVLGLVWVGDALIYVVMPLHAPAFGIGLGAVGVVLAVNRIVRILGYGWVSTLSRRYGMRALTATAALGAALSTIAYGVLGGLVALLLARLVWGLAYGVLNVTTTAYAIGDGTDTGRRVGLNRAVSGVGPVLALSVGAWLALELGPRGVFVALGAFGLLAVPLALTLPRTLRTAPGARAAGTRWRPSSLNVLFFANAAIEGAFTFTLSLLFAGVLPLTSALLAAGLILAFQRLMIVLLSLVGGALIDRIGPYRVLVPCVGVVVVALVALAHGALYPAAITIVIARAFLGTTGPVLAARERSGNTVERLAAFATWVDSGLALGPLVSGVVVARFGLPALYQALAVVIAVALAAHLLERRRGALVTARAA
jgi:DHA1 family inner membrane transport protein